MLCRHCQKRQANRPRQMCWACFYTPSVRALYPSTSKFAPKNDEKDFVPRTTPMRIVPDHTRGPWCEHGREEGECPVCERVQRVGLVLVEEASDEE